MTERAVWGVDISACAIRAVLLEKREQGEVHLAAFDVIDFAEEADATQSAGRFVPMTQGLRHFLFRHDLSRTHVVVGLRGEPAFNRRVASSPEVMGVSSPAEILALEAQHSVPFGTDEAFIDHKLLRVRRDGTVDAILFAVRRDVVTERIEHLRRHNLPVDAVHLNPVALFNACRRAGYAVDGDILVDVDYQASQVVICHDGGFWFRCLPIGSFEVAALLRQELGEKKHSAMRIARGDQEPGDRAAFDAIRARAAETIAAEIVDVIAFHRAAQPDATPARIVLFRSSPATPPLVGRLREATGLPVTAVKGFPGLVVDDEIRTELLEKHHDDLAKAIGLGLIGLGVADVDVRLHPPDLRRELPRRRVPVLLGVLAVVFALLVVWKRTVAARERVEAAIARTGDAAERIEAARAEDRALDQRIRAGEAALRPYAAAGAGRDVPALACRAFLEAVTAAPEGGAGPIHVVELEATAGADRTTAALRAIVGIELREASAAAARSLESRLRERLDAGRGFPALEPGETFLGADLGTTPDPAAEGRPLRRRYLMMRLRLTFDPAGGVR